MHQEGRLATVKLQFTKRKRQYKRKTYEYERISLHFPPKYNTTLQALRDKQLKISVTAQGSIITVSLSEK